MKMVGHIVSGGLVGQQPVRVGRKWCSSTGSPQPQEPAQPQLASHHCWPTKTACDAPPSGGGQSVNTSVNRNPTGDSLTRNNHSINNIDNLYRTTKQATISPIVQLVNNNVPKPRPIVSSPLSTHKFSCQMIDQQSSILKQPLIRISVRLFQEESLDFRKTTNIQQQTQVINEQFNVNRLSKYQRTPFKISPAQQTKIKATDQDLNTCNIHPNTTYLTLLVIIYIVLISLTSQAKFCSANKDQRVLASDFYWPSSKVNQHYFNFQQQQQRQLMQEPQRNSFNQPDNFFIIQKQVQPQLRQANHGIRSIVSPNGNRRSFSSAAAAAAASAAAAIATANAALARRGQSNNLMIGQNFNNFSSAVPYSVMMQDVDYSSIQEDPIINEPATIDNQAASTTQQQLPNKLPEHSESGSNGLLDEDQRPVRQQHFFGESGGADQFDSKSVSIDGHQNSSNYYAQTNMVLNPSPLSALSLPMRPRSASHRLVNVDSAVVLPQVITGRKRVSSELANDRALLPLDSSRLMLPQMQQIKARFNQGCVGGTKCQFFAFCWMSGGSLGASCGLLMTCCVTPSRQEIQPGFFGPVVNDPYCGRSTSKINRIVGGTDASFGQFPWQAFVQVGGSRCGGALISSRHVVTAGHCVARSQHSPSSIKVTLGDYILNSDIESIPHEVFSVVEVLLHPNFRFTPQADRYDVAVLELDRTASYKDNIKPICLPQKDATFVGRAAYVAGWGALQAGSKLRPKVLQHVAVPVIENHVCESWHRRKGIDIRIYDEMMCAGYEMGQRDACQGDSGGPLMLNQFGVWYLVGIVSAGYSCAKQYQPGIYHRVSSSSDWISSNVYQQGSSK